MTDLIGRPDRDPAAWADLRATYDTVAAKYADKYLHELDGKSFDHDLLSRFADAVRARSLAGSPVCDLGCGPGHVAGFLAERGVAVTGIDLSAGMVEVARRSFPTLTFSEGDMTSLALPDASFNGIVCFYALIHIPRSRVPVALGEMRRVLAPGGPLLLAVHGGQGSLHRDEMLGEAVDFEATLFSLAELSSLVGAAGFKVVEALERAPYEQEAQTQRLYVWAVGT